MMTASHHHFSEYGLARTIVVSNNLWSWHNKNKAKPKHVMPRAQSVLPIMTAARQTCVDIMVNASRAPPMVKLATSAFAAVSSTMLALIGCNAAKKHTLEAIASLNAKQRLATSAWKISTAATVCTALVMVAAARKRLTRCFNDQDQILKKLN